MHQLDEQHTHTHNSPVEHSSAIRVHERSPERYAHSAARVTFVRKTDQQCRYWVVSLGKPLNIVSEQYRTE